MDKKEIIKALNSSVKELQHGIDTHCCLVASILEAQVDEQDLPPMLDICSRRSRENRLKKAIKEAIDVIEESRKSFKSKRLEVLRKKLTSVLIGAE